MMSNPSKAVNNRVLAWSCNTPSVGQQGDYLPNAETLMCPNDNERNDFRGPGHFGPMPYRLPGDTSPAEMSYCYFFVHPDVVDSVNNTFYQGYPRFNFAASPPEATILTDEGWFDFHDLLSGNSFFKYYYNHDDGWNYLHMDGHANFGERKELTRAWNEAGNIHGDYWIRAMIAHDAFQ